MGLNIGDIFQNIQKDVGAGMNDILKLGGNAALGYLEQQAINVLEAHKSELEGQFQSDLKDVIKRPSSANSIGAYVGNIAKSPIVTEYGPYILGVVVVVALGTLFLKGK
jgi:hypothetical protein